MSLPENYFQLITLELERVEEMCGKASTPEEMLYYFSAAYGIINRVMNFHCEPSLVFMHQVLQAAHQAFQNRLSSPRNPNSESFMGTPAELIEKLMMYFRGLREAFEGKDEIAIWRALEKFSNLTYATTGNGFYLYQTGKLVP